MVVILVMGLSIAFNMLVMNFSLESFNVILNDNSLCYDVQESMEQEADAFELYVRERSWENAKQYRLACFKTESSLDALPFDYDVIGPERYARTWNIKNGYEGYQTFRDQVLHMDQSDEGFVEQLYRVYGMQGYLQTYARRLMQSTLKEGKRSYQEKVPLLYDLPYMIMACSVLMIITVICLTKLLSNTLIAPMVKLAHSSREIARNDFGGEDLVVENRDEMGELVQAFNKMKHATEGYINTLKEKNEMAERLHKEEVERIEMEKRLDAARLELLKSQINPHFLYNTLDTIRSMAIIRDSEDIAQMAESLSMLFRYSISRPGEMATLKDELDNVKNYLVIQGYRFPGKFKYQQRIEDEELLQYKLPVLTIQPVIENAIHHGLETKVGGGQVSVYAYSTQERFIIRIADNGMGMTEQQMDSLRERLSKGRFIYEQDRDLKKRGNTGIALPNVNQRIKFYYGDDYGIKVYSTAGIGTIVEIILPAAADSKGGES